MANAKQCDICGKFYAAHKVDRRCRDYYGDTNLVRLYDLGSDLTNPKEVERSFEACPVCFKRVTKFIDALSNEGACEEPECGFLV